MGIRDLLLMEPGVERDDAYKKHGLKQLNRDYISNTYTKFDDEPKVKNIRIVGDRANIGRKELDIEKEICCYLVNKKIEFWNMKIKGEVQSIGNGKAILKASENRGFPDILSCIKGVFVGIEVKSPGKYQSTYQQVMQKRIEKAGGHYLIVTSVKELNALLMKNNLI